MIKIGNAHKIFGKILAQEDLQIVQSNVSTAMFDLKRRIVYIPYWNSKDGLEEDVITMLLAHEVSHALHTPLEDIHSTDKDKTHEKIPFSYINIVEDARIERLICEEYPGLYMIFDRGYESLSQTQLKEHLADFDPRMGLFIDRLNYFFKFYQRDGKKVTTDDLFVNSTERDLLQRVKTVDTFDEVLEICRDIMEYSKHEQTPEENQSDQTNHIDPANNLEDSDGPSCGEFENDQDTKNDEEPSQDPQSEHGKSGEDSEEGENENSESPQKQSPTTKSDESKDESKDEGDDLLKSGKSSGMTKTDDDAPKIKDPVSNDWIHDISECDVDTRMVEMPDIRTANILENCLLDASKID